MIPASHPTSCQACRGSGWMDAPPAYETVNGQPHPYTQVTPCTHIWWDDEPHLDLEERTAHG